MCVKFPIGDMNPDPCPPHPTSTYTCEVTIAPNVCDGGMINYWLTRQWFTQKEGGEWLLGQRRPCRLSQRWTHIEAKGVA